MFAVIRTGGKQYRVAKDDVIAVEKLAGKPGAVVEIQDVLMIGDDGKAASVGAPVLDKAAVFAEVLDQARDDKIIVFKKKRRKRYRRTRGHRQDVTVLKITGISPTGQKPAAKAKTEPKPKAEAKEPAKPPAKEAEKPAAKELAKPAAKKEAKKEAPAKKEAKKEPKAKPKAKPKAEAKAKPAAKKETKAKPKPKPKPKPKDKAAAKKKE